MGTTASNWSYSSMSRLKGSKQSEVSSPDVKVMRKRYIAVTPKTPDFLKTPISWDSYLGETVSFLDSNSFRNLTYVSKNLSDRFQSRGDKVSIAATFKLFGDGYGHKLRFHETSLTSHPTSRNVVPLSEWINVCDLSLGFFHAKVPGGSQTSTSMALALASSFLSEVRYRKSLFTVFDRKVDQLCANSYLLAFTALAIAIKVEVIPCSCFGRILHFFLYFLTFIPQEGLYFKCDSIPFPTYEATEAFRPSLSRHSVLAAEQIILRVLKMTVPICHFSQFARPLWHRIMALDNQQWRQQFSSKRNDIKPSIPLQAKQVSFKNT